MIIEEFKILGTLPSVNGLLRGSKEYADVKKKLTDIFEKNYKGYKLIDFAVSVEIYHYLEEDEYYKEDVDNKQKIIQDAMSGILITDDSIIVSIYSEKKIAKSEEYFTVLIREYNETKNINCGEIIGSINSHQERELKLRELQISEKDKQINKLIDENIAKDNKILQIEKEIQDRRSEIIKLKNTLEERDKNLSIKSNSIDNHIRDKQHLKEENKNLLEEIEKLKQNVEEKEKDISRKNNTINSHVRDKNHLKEENKHLLEEIEKLKQNVEEKEKDISRKNNTINSHVRDKNHLKEENKHLFEEIENLKHTVEENEEDISRKNNTINSQIIDTNYLKEENKHSFEEIEKLKQNVEENEKDISRKNNTINSQIIDTNYLKEENKNLLEEIEKLKQNVEENEENENIQNIEIEEKDVEFNENTDFFAYGDGTYHIDNYITNKASKEFIESVINEFDKKNFILKETIKNKMSEIKVKKLIKDIYNIKLKSEGDKLIVNIN